MLLCSHRGDRCAVLQAIASRLSLAQAPAPFRRDLEFLAWWTEAERRPAHPTEHYRAHRAAQRHRLLASTAGHAHEAHDLHLLVGTEFMLFRLELQRVDQCVTQPLAVARVAAHQGLEVQCAFMAEA